MSSILTNSSALTALQNLNNTQRALSKTQSQISTGLKVATAADNATNWSVSTQMKSDNSVLGTVKDSLKQNSALVKTTTAALSQVVETITKIKEQLTQAKDVDGTAPTAAAGYAEINKALDGLGKTLDGLVKGANFNGVNLLTGGDATTAGDALRVVTGYSEKTFTSISGPASVNLLSATATGLDGLINLADINAPDAPAGTGSIATAMGLADDALKVVRELAADFGAVQNQIEAQSKFIEVLSDSLTNGVSAMVDADMNEASTRLQALQTQQQLGVQSLSIANQNSQMILKLFN
ncbi:flagellin [Microvirga terrae]|uniref:Flagellin n=1 Tax=Microvirga terrae TaxID=2740529 RepID=A0ABY5RTF9_9HYPH|nr:MULTISPECIES: flagellin [Microvirga]MBQ0824756.1 flagellar hook associated protein [Microvirga sp. HBU67558]UVF20308.1 flagellin [Microvirga terrae]